MKQIAIQYNFDWQNTYRLVYNDFEKSLNNSVFVVEEEMTKKEIQTLKKLFKRFESEAQ